MLELNKVVGEIADKGRMDGLIAATEIQQETPALEHTPEDANRMFEVNITGVFMTAQAVAKQMIRFKSGGSIVLSCPCRPPSPIEVLSVRRTMRPRLAWCSWHAT